MKRLWNVINEMKIKKEIKIKLYLGVLIAINIVMGGVAWLLFGRLVLPRIEWLICFMGYPAMFIGLFGGLIYLYNHEFA